LVDDHLKRWNPHKRTLICITGLPGSGKTEAIEYYKKKGLPEVSFSNIINEHVEKLGLEHIESVHSKWRVEFRKEYGPACMAILSKDKIHAMLEDNPIGIIGGMYTLDEYEYVKKEFPHVHTFVVAIHADKQLRYDRCALRSERNKLIGPERDLNQLKQLNMGNLIAYADFLVKNNFSKDEYFDKLEEVYRAIYFS
jgi:dephospho-CoA kinase